MKKLKKCRFCKSSEIKVVIDLGNQYLTGVFPKFLKESITNGPLKLLICNNCSLLQLSYTYNLSEMYGDNYGYRSGLNKSMVKHIGLKIRKLEKYINKGDLVLDIGSNDGTLLKQYKKKNIIKYGIDPTGKKFKKYYTKDIKLIPKFFSYKNFSLVCLQKPKMITSLAMFYDLESPLDFAKDIEKILDNHGYWHFEQSYMPLMIENNSFDTICHEHLEYYSLKVILKILNEAKLKIHDVEINDINGGSIAITAVKKINNIKTKKSKTILNLLNYEKNKKFSNINIYKKFNKRIILFKKEIIRFLKFLKSNNKVVFGYGASTKGNVILQYCKIDKTYLPYIVDINKDKLGKFTPGSNIPIISENKAKLLKPDYYLVFPWHFKKMIIKKEKKYIKSGGKLIFPLPRIQIIDKRNYNSII